jgi:23S rRNA (cytidine1920-2'-O)/16S rRNA (cytidine1409-2'-O)-methyltransferase
MPRSARVRLDRVLVERGFFDSREKAQRAILAGEVRIDGHVADKPGMSPKADAEFAVQEKSRYVSRAGYKLEAALDYFGESPEGKLCLDVGASTGGFTDCLLQRGARQVLAIDVGHGQLDWKVRSDSRVVVYEKVNARYLSADHFPEAISFAVIDVSFISLKLILPPVASILERSYARGVVQPAASGTIVALIKPQVELGREEVTQGAGIIRNPAAHARAVSGIEVFCRQALPRWQWLGVIASPITGAEGNQEFLACLQLPPALSPN